MPMRWAPADPVGSSNALAVAAGQRRANERPGAASRTSSLTPMPRDEAAAQRTASFQDQYRGSSQERRWGPPDQYRGGSQERRWAPADGRGPATRSRAGSQERGSWAGPPPERGRARAGSQERYGSAPGSRALSPHPG